jgi:Carboxypeptidase regulatory-like domain
MGRGFAIRIPSLILLILIGATHLAAQELATLNVTVTDQSGGVIPHSRVTLQSLETGAQRTEVSSAAGVAVIPGLAAGNYEVTVTAARFSDFKSVIVLTVGQTASFTAVLGVAGVKQQVEVRESVQGVDSAKSEVSQVIDPQQISDLPIAGRDFIDFVLLTPTANVGRSTAVGSQSPFTETVLELSFGGLRETHSSFFGLDGVDYTTSISGVQRVSPSQDWVQEFRVVSSAYTADYGRNLGSVVNTITKSGGNDIHGSAYEYFRNDAMDATNLLAAPGFDTLRFNQFGADAGGPIRKNKNFYFVGYEG